MGGSSPFTAALFDALASHRLEGWTLTLQGRDVRSLEIVRQYAENRLGSLGWVIRATPDRRRALHGCDFVIHQARYGGLTGRRRGEDLAARHRVVADETLGPSALRSAALATSELAHLAADLTSECPEAWVINLTNPLGITVATLARLGVARCLGVCELPLTTARKVATAVGVPLERLQWSYSGLNHRGFLHHLTTDHTDLIPMLVERLHGDSLDGVLAGEIEELSCVPTKYFRLTREGAESHPRAAFLARMRRQALRELSLNPYESPPALRRRNLDWYSEAVVPVLMSLVARAGGIHVINCADRDETVFETKVQFRPEGLEPVAAPPPPPAARRWLDLFTQHENAVLRASLEPSRSSLEDALVLDPVVPAGVVAPLTRELLRDVASAGARARSGEAN